MALRFLGKTSLVGLEPLSYEGVPVLDAHARVREALRQRGESEAAELFAEPIVTWSSGGGARDGSVSWYAEAEGTPEPLTAVAEDRRRVLEQRLRQVLARLVPALVDPQIGPLLQRVLIVSSPAGIVAVGERIILTEWGLEAAGTPRPADSLAALQASPIGAYLPPLAGGAGGIATAAAATGAATAAGLAARRAAPGARAAAGMAAGGAAVGLAAAAGPRRRVWSWWLVPAALLLAAAFLALGWWLAICLLGTRPTSVGLFDEPQARAALQAQLDQNAALEREIAARRQALAGDVCRADPAQMPRLGPDRAAAPSPAAVPAPPGAAAFQGSLADLLKQALVMVVVPTEEGISTGSGFFVAPDLIVTNHHVVEKAREGQVFVINEKLGRATRAQILAKSPVVEIGQLDVALLRIGHPPAVQPLALTTTAAQLDPVIAAGYPGLTLQGDAAFQRLIEDGDVTAVPGVILTDGRINAIQDSGSGLKILPHSAAISGGNSGGPLVDSCGRVVGINTFILSDAQQTAHVNYAQKADAVIAFLREHGAAPTEVSGPCAPAGSTPAPATPQGTPAPAAPTPAAPQAAPAPAAAPAVQAPAAPPAAQPPASASPPPASTRSR